jgi:hypothetical protein
MSVSVRTAFEKCIARAELTWTIQKNFSAKRNRCTVLSHKTSRLELRRENNGFLHLEDKTMTINRLWRATIQMRFIAVIAIGMTMAACASDESFWDYQEKQTSTVTVAEQLTDSSSPVGKWYLVANGHRLELTITESGRGYNGTIGNEGASQQVASNITWNTGDRLIRHINLPYLSYLMI